MAAEALLSIRDLAVEFRTDDGIVHAVDGVSYDVFPGETLGIVGESGSGKSVSTMSILGLIPQPPGRVVRGEALFKGTDLLKLSKKALRRVRGNEMAMVFQDPMTSLNPVLKIGYQIGEAIKTHHPEQKDTAIKRRALDLLKLVGVPNPERRVDQYPHEFSGGMRQRAMIAMAISNDPAVLIADEPTTALDVTIQAQVLEVLERIQDRTDSAIVLIQLDPAKRAHVGDPLALRHFLRDLYTHRRKNLPGYREEDRRERVCHGADAAHARLHAPAAAWCSSRGRARNGGRSEHGRGVSRQYAGFRTSARL